MNRVQQQALLRLRTLADPAYRQFNLKLKPSENRELLGVRMPQIRKLAGQIVKNGGLEGLMEGLGSVECNEMVLLKAAAFSNLSLPSKEIFEMVLRFIPEIDGWGACDALASSLKDAAVHPDEWWNYVKALFVNPMPYARRLAMVLCLTYFNDDRHVDEALSLIGRGDLSHFYVAMGAAWALSMYFVKFPQKTASFVQNDLSFPRVGIMAMTKVLESRQARGSVRDLARDLRARLKVKLKKSEGMDL